ncbi:MAG TPA: O-antigen ligase [Alphaproteobacteria bacterium]|nr:O-antigen ligase [Alphaproteobacteria bacterium]
MKNLALTSPGVRPVFRQQPKAGYPQLRPLYAVPSVAATVVIMAYSGLFGLWPILLFYALWLPRTFYKGRFILRLSREMIMPAALGIYSLMSVLWSQYPTITARAGLEFLSMLACTFIMARLVDGRSLRRGLIAGVVIVMAATLIDGHYGGDPFTKVYALIGLFGSKNQVGFFAEIGIYAALLSLFGGDRRAEKFLFALPALALCAACLALSRSATSAISLAAMIFAALGTVFLARLSPRRRVPVFIAGAIALLIAAGVAAYMGEQIALLHMMGKDSTLTGRTYLWAQGAAIGLKDPMLGHGFYAFWVPGEPDAERLWYHFGIYNRSGFHFHDTFIHSFVDLGIVGTLTITYLIAANCVKSYRYAIREGIDAAALLFVGLAAMFAVRAVVEVDFWGPFGIGQLLFYAIGPYLAARPPMSKQTETVR